MVDKSVIESRLQRIDVHIEKLLRYAEISFDDFMASTDIQDIVEYNLFQIVNHIIDIMQHIVVDEDYGYPQTAFESACILQQHGVFKEEDLAIIKKMIGFRNIVGHEYISLDKKIVHQVLTEEKSAVRKLVSGIVEKYL